MITGSRAEIHSYQILEITYSILYIFTKTSASETQVFAAVSVLLEYRLHIGREVTTPL